MSVFENLLKKLKKEQLLCDYDRDHVIEETDTGVLTDFNDELCYWSLIHEDGTADGISIVKTKDITRIRWEGNGREADALLMKEKNTKLVNPPLAIGSLCEAIESVQNRFGYVNVHTEYMDEMCFVGEVEEMDNEHLIIHNYGTKNSLTRSRIILPLEEISRIDADSQYERDIVFLGKKKEK